jgi:hypothetical protein
MEMAVFWVVVLEIWQKFTIVSEVFSSCIIRAVCWYLFYIMFKRNKLLGLTEIRFHIEHKSGILQKLFVFQQ